MISDTLSNAAYCVSLRGPGDESEGAINDPPPPSDDGKSTRGLTIRQLCAAVSLVYE